MQDNTNHYLTLDGQGRIVAKVIVEDLTIADRLYPYELIEEGNYINVSRVYTLDEIATKNITYRSKGE
ncbi:hypothetical protein ACRCJP_01330 [Aerococcus urinaeequi]|uniref:hypothetical protein n=1 Tax=Aerococcus urinaeequi TaxID=51665 RepID=UPI003B44CBC2